MTERKPSTNQPSHIAYQIIHRGDDAYWRRIGAAWPHSDGEGFNIEFDAVPLSGRLTLRVRSDKKPQELVE